MDTPYDLILVRAIWDKLNKEDHLIAIDEIIDFLDSNPALAKINRNDETLYLWK